MSELDDVLDAAREFAVEAGGITLRHFGHVLESRDKADGTPVTRADREAERLMRERIQEGFPSHGIVGEEFGEEKPGARIRWILDPIDGTRSFMRGVPLYGVMIGVEVDGEPRVGVIHFPALDETVSACLGLGCSWNGAAASVSGVDRLSDAAVLTTDPRTAPTLSGWEALRDEAGLVRTWGDCYGHCLVATGRAEAMVDPELALWDAAPLLPIVAEAGGRFTDLEGRSSVQGGSGLSTNGRLHRDVLEILQGKA